MKRLVVAAFVLVATALHAAIGFAQSWDEPNADAYPIIAQLYDSPSQYNGKTVVIYGLVIEASSDGSFMLQDVSGHPLKIVPGPKIKAAVGDQLIIFGTFNAARTPYVRAKSLIAAKVLAGGGCC